MQRATFVVRCFFCCTLLFAAFFCTFVVFCFFVAHLLYSLFHEKSVVALLCAFCLLCLHNRKLSLKFAE